MFFYKINIMIKSLLIKLGIILWSCYKVKFREISGDFTSVISNILICGVNGMSRMFNRVLIRFLDPKNIRLDTKKHDSTLIISR